MSGIRLHFVYDIAFLSRELNAPSRHVTETNKKWLGHKLQYAHQLQTMFSVEEN
jgi:hypothetical protein